MINSVQRLLGQSKRQEKALLFCEVSTVEQAEACLEAAELELSPVVLTLAATTGKQMERLPSLLAVSHWLADRAPIHVGLELRGSSITAPLLRQQTAEWKQYGALTISLPITAGEGGMGIATLIQARKLQQHTFRALRLPVTTSSELVELARGLKVPLILEESEFSPAKLKATLRSGVSGITLADQLNLSFTAGVRAALRNREVSDPERYLAHGRLAVKERVRNYLRHF